MVRTARQNEIIEGSLALMAAHGMEGLTYRNLSERFGISVPAFYRHFPSKNDILLAIMEYMEEISLDLFMSAEAEGTDPLDRLRLVLTGYARLFSDNSGLAEVLFPDRIGESKHELVDSVLHFMGENERRLTALLADGQDVGLVRADISASRWALLLMASLRLAVTRWRLRRRETDLVKEIVALWADLELVLRPLRPEATGV